MTKEARDAALDSMSEFNQKNPNRKNTGAEEGFYTAGFLAGWKARDKQESK